MWHVAEADKLALGYLFGDLSAEERDQFEERYFVDDSLHERLLALEDELIDAYVGDALSREERQKFERLFLQSPERQERLKFAQALARFGERHPNLKEERGGHLASESRHQKGLLFWPFHLGRSTSLRSALTGAAIVAVMVTFAIWQNGRRPEIARSIIPPGQSNVAPPSPIISPTPGIAVAEPRATMKGQQKAVPKAPLHPVLSFVLLPLERDSQQENVVSVPQGLYTIELRLSVEPDKYRAYRVTIQAVDADNLMEKDGLKPHAMRNGNHVVSIFLPAEDLPSGYYSLRLEGVVPAGENEVLGGYSFRVARAHMK